MNKRHVHGKWVVTASKISYVCTWEKEGKQIIARAWETPDHSKEREKRIVAQETQEIQKEGEEEERGVAIIAMQRLLRTLSEKIGAGEYFKEL